MCTVECIKYVLESHQSGFKKLACHRVDGGGGDILCSAGSPASAGTAAEAAVAAAAVAVGAGSLRGPPRRCGPAPPSPFHCLSNNCFSAKFVFLGPFQTGKSIS